MADPAQPIPAAANRRVRWWPLFLILLLGVASVIYIRFGFGRQRQDENIAIANVVVIGFLLSLIWVIFFSRFAAKIRFSILGLVVATLVLVHTLFKIHGVTGD